MYLIIFLIFIVIWIFRLIRLYKKRSNKRLSFCIQSIILSILICLTLWFFDFYPFAQNIYFKNRSEELTGKKFWSRKVLNFEDPSVRGEGYQLQIFKFSNEMAEYFKSPDTEFFTDYPHYSDKRWTPTPIDSNEYEILDFVTARYPNFKEDIISQQNAIRKILLNKGAYYSYSKGNSSNVNFYIIYPKDRLVILIYHNM
jgi:hypothetical protein